MEFFLAFRVAIPTMVAGVVALSDQPGPTKVGIQSLEESEEGLIPLDDLDEALKNADPELKAQLDTISQEGKQDFSGSIELFDYVEEVPVKGKGNIRVLLKKLSMHGRKVFFQARAWVLEFLKSDVPEAMAVVSEALRQFAYKPKKFKRMVFGFAGICLVAGAALVFLWKKGLPEETPLFMQSMAEVADETVVIEPGAEKEAFYESVRVAQNTLVLSKMAVNLKVASENSRPSMAMAEFYLEGNSPEVVVEIKAREVEFKDLFMRTMENFTGVELEDAAGKQKLLDRLVKEANRLTTKGRVQKVFFKTIVLQI